MLLLYHAAEYFAVMENANDRVNLTKVSLLFEHTMEIIILFLYKNTSLYVVSHFVYVCNLCRGLFLIHVITRIKLTIIIFFV